MQTATHEPQAMTEKKHGGARSGAGRKRAQQSAFGEWAERNKKTAAELAKSLGLSKSMTAQLMAGRRRPSLEVMDQIRTLTGGEVDFASWLKTPAKSN